jgi:hypothetical protein
MVSFKDLKIGQKLVRSSNIHGDTYIVSEALYKTSLSKNAIKLDNEFGAVKNIPFIIEWDDEKKLELYP